MTPVVANAPSPVALESTRPQRPMSTAVLSAESDASEQTAITPPPVFTPLPPPIAPTAASAPFAATLPSAPLQPAVVAPPSPRLRRLAIPVAITAVAVLGVTVALAMRLCL